MGNPDSFHYLNQSSCYELIGVNDAHEYLATRRAMDIVGISEEEQVQFSVGLEAWKLHIKIIFSSLSLILRIQFSKLLQQFFILVILNLIREKKVIQQL